MPTSWWCNPYNIVTLLKATTWMDFIHPSKISATKRIFEKHTYQNQETMDYIINLKVLHTE